MDTLVQRSVTSPLRHLHSSSSGEDIPSIVLIAQLDPEPVCESKGSAQANGRKRGDGPRRREEEDV